jgi:hypothetical protein
VASSTAPRQAMHLESPARRGLSGRQRYDLPAACCSAVQHQPATSASSCSLQRPSWRRRSGHVGCGTRALFGHSLVLRSLHCFLFLTAIVLPPGFEPEPPSSGTLHTRVLLTGRATGLVFCNRLRCTSAQPGRLFSHSAPVGATIASGSSPLSLLVAASSATAVRDHDAIDQP